MSTLTEEAKSAGADDTFVTFQASPEILAMLTALLKDLEELKKNYVHEWHIENDRLIKISEWRISFHEKLILLAGGSFALSLTFLSALQRHVLQGKTFTAMINLKGAWISLLLCIVFSWLHNLCRCAGVENLTNLTSANIIALHQTWTADLTMRAAAIFKVIESPGLGVSGGFSAVAKNLRTLSDKSSEGAAEHLRGSTKIYRFSAALSGLALLSVILAFVLMLVFAINNAALL